MTKKAKLDPGLEQWRQRVEAKVEEAPEAKLETTEEMSDEEPETRQEPQADEDRRWWEFRRRPYWR